MCVNTQNIMYAKILVCKGAETVIYTTRIKELREDNDLKQKDVAKILGIDQQYYSQYERGVNELPIRHLIKLCTYYGVSADYILGLPKDLLYIDRDI